MIGQTISHFKVIEKIGQGGMGVVYRAQDTNLSRDVAIKVLPEQFTQDPQRLARFEREAKLLASLNHPNIAAIHSFEHSDDIHFLVLELVEGETLADLLTKGPVPVEKTLELCQQIAEGVEAAHEKGVIHRDLKPANVKVTPEGKVKILDFGLAKAFEGEVPVTDISQSPTLTEEMTRAGVILGTAAYMSPEQAKGKPVDKRTDIFAFGCVLYELLTGKRAFEGETVTETLAKVLEGEPDWNALPGVLPSTIRFLISRCLQKDPAKRLQHIDGARILIEEALTGAVNASAIEVSGATQAPLWRRAIPWSVAAVAVVVAGLAWWSLTPLEPKPLRKFVLTPSPSAPLVNRGGNDLAISPDGRQVIYRSSSQQLYLRSLDELVDRPIPGTEGAAGQAFFSPDGDSLAFFADSKLKKVSLMGGPPITLSDAPPTGRTGSWDDEGTIVFSAGRGTVTVLYQVSAAGGEPELLATPNADDGEIRYVTPHVLTDGENVLFSINSGPGIPYQIAVLSLETKEQKTILANGRQAHYVPTGHLVYEQGSGTLMAVPFDLARLEVTGDPVPVLEGVRQAAGGSVDYSLSTEGTLVYVPSGENVASTLVWVDREGTERLVTQEKRGYSSPDISPDGKQVALQMIEDTGNLNVWTYDFDGDSFSRLTFEGTRNGSPTWSPDGEWIMFQGGDPGARGLARQRADRSGSVERLTTSSIAQIPGSWSPDGRVLALTLQPGDTDIALFSMEDDSEPQPFIQSSTWECCPMFSPDGQWLAYVSEDTGQPGVYVRPYPEPDVKWLVSGEEGGSEPVWSPDGTELFYRSDNKMMVVSIRTEPTFNASRPQVLFEGSYLVTTLTRGNQYYDISPDGQRFLMIKEPEGQSQINVVLNWFEELKRLVPTN